MIGKPIPSGNTLVDYSTSEVATNEYWMGKRVYAKLFNITLNSIPSGSTEVLTSYVTDIQPQKTIGHPIGYVVYTYNNVEYCDGIPNRTLNITASGKNNMGGTNRLGLYIRHSDTNYDGGALTVLVKYTKD